MEEKKLTDEEIVKDIERSTGMPSYWKTIVLDLIHRLQGKIGEYERKLVDGELVSKEWHDEQVLHLEEQCQQFLYDFEQKKAEIERLTAKYRNLEINYNATWEDYRKYEVENAELQKQVDELKKSQANKYALEAIYNNGYEHAVKDTAKEILELIDAVKEVFPNDPSGYDMAHGWSMCIDKLKEIIKSKGVEVE